jgi:hypothetical protein
LELSSQFVQRIQRFRKDIHVAFVNQLDQVVQILVGNSVHYQDRMVSVVFGEYPVEIGTAGRQDQLVGFDGTVLAAQSDVSKLLVVVQLLEHFTDVFQVLVGRKLNARLHLERKSSLM